MISKAQLLNGALKLQGQRDVDQDLLAGFVAIIRSDLLNGTRLLETLLTTDLFEPLFDLPLFVSDEPQISETMLLC
jgi:hypothetical protein